MTYLKKALYIWTINSKLFGITIYRCKHFILRFFRILLLVCLLTPYSLAFVGVFDDDIVVWNFILDLMINISFLIDLVLTFFSAYEDEKLNIIDDKWVSLNY